MESLKKTVQLLNTYVFSRCTGKPSTASFWYLPEPPYLTDQTALANYKSSRAPLYLMDYRSKLQYTLQNEQQIIVLPYPHPIGPQINPEAAFQYALGLHDDYLMTGDKQKFEQFWHYVDYFLARQTKEGDWCYDFDWYESTAPWSSALAQSRGASVMLRAWLHSNNPLYLEAAKRAFSKFDKPCREGGYCEVFKAENCCYFEEYPANPMGVINGFMASLFGIWELSIWLKEACWTELWQQGVNSLEKMLPYYTWHGWTLYDVGKKTGIPNVNSPRYHGLMISYLQVLTTLHESSVFKKYQALWVKNNVMSQKITAIILKALYKINYR